MIHYSTDLTQKEEQRQRNSQSADSMTDLLGLGLDEPTAPAAPTSEDQTPETTAETAAASTECATAESVPSDGHPLEAEAGKDTAGANVTENDGKADGEEEGAVTGVHKLELKEIEEKFGGRWKLVRTDPYDEYLKSLGVGLVTRKLAGKSWPDQIVTVEGDSIHVLLKSVFHSQTYVFKLEESTENVVEKVAQSVFTSYKEGKLTHHMTPLGDGMGKTQAIERSINDNGEQVVIHTSGSATCRRYFAKFVTPGAVTQQSKETPEPEVPETEKSKTPEETPPTEQPKQDEETGKTEQPPNSN